MLLNEIPVPAVARLQRQPGTFPVPGRQHLAPGCVCGELPPRLPAGLAVPVLGSVGEGRSPGARRFPALSRTAVNASITVFLPFFS